MLRLAPSLLYNMWYFSFKHILHLFVVEWCSILQSPANLVACSTMFSILNVGAQRSLRSAGFFSHVCIVLIISLLEWPTCNSCIVLLSTRYILCHCGFINYAAGLTSAFNWAVLWLSLTIIPDLEIVRSVSGNLNVFTEKFLRKEGIYWVKNAWLCAEMILTIGICSKKQSC